MPDTPIITVEVAYAPPGEQNLLEVKLKAGATVEQAIIQSGVLQAYPEIDLEQHNKVGIFGKISRLDQPLQAGDRVEIYRPLKADPKVVRKLRAAQGKTMKRGEREGR